MPGEFLSELDHTVLLRTCRRSTLDNSPCVSHGRPSMQATTVEEAMQEVDAIMALGHNIWTYAYVTSSEPA